MSRNRLETIIRNVHFVDNMSISEAKKKKDRLWKLRAWITNLRNNFLQVTAEEYHAVDEIMIPFKGQSIMRQYVHNKPHRWGFKIWGRSGVSG